MITNETAKLPLGKEPILLGSCDLAHIYFPKSQGYLPITARIFQENQQIMMQFHEQMRTIKKMGVA